MINPFLLFWPNFFFFNLSWWPSLCTDGWQVVANESCVPSGKQPPWQPLLPPISSSPLPPTPTRQQPEGAAQIKHCCIISRDIFLRGFSFVKTRKSTTIGKQHFNYLWIFQIKCRNPPTLNKMFAQNLYFVQYLHPPPIPSGAGLWGWKYLLSLLPRYFFMKYRIFPCFGGLENENIIHHISTN